MNKNAELHDKIIEKAGELFREQGYAATSIKQIAKAAGCTNAALYYYFEGGKEHILREVIHDSTIENMEFLTAVSTYDNLESFIIGLSQNLNEALVHIADRVNWLLLQFPTLPDEEKAFLQEQIQGFHDALKLRISHFVTDEVMADHLAWFIFCSFIGYQQIFNSIGLGQGVAFSLEDYGRFMGSILKDSNQ